MLLRRDTINNVEFAIWQLTETLQELKNEVGEIDVADFDRMCEKRQRELLGVRLLLKKMMGDVVLEYDAVGKPRLKNGDKNISISHTDGYIVIAACEDCACGVDVECHSHRAFRVKERFLNEEEMKHVKGGAEDGCTLAWCAKEATYKMLSTDVDMLEGIVIEGMNDREIRTRVKETGERIVLNYFRTEDYILVLGKA